MTVRLERDTGLAYHTRQITNRLDSAIGTAVIVDEEALSPDVVMVLQVIRKNGCLIPSRNDDGKARTDKPSLLAVQYRADRPAFNRTEKPGRSVCFGYLPVKCC